MKTYTVTKEDVGKRLDMWLAEVLNLSRSAVQKKVKEGNVLIDGKPISAHRLLKDNEVVMVKERIKKEKEIREETIIPEIPIIAETDDYLVVNKPSGVLMHGGDRELRLTLVDWLVKKYPKIIKVGEDPSRPGIVHRIDKDVSGLVVIAKTQKFFDHIKKQFQDRTTTKRYEALVYGADMPDEGEILFRLERSTKGYRMAARPLNQEGKIAITQFTVEKRFHNYTLLSLIIKTGRTHQIRAHLAAYNHPIVGDDLYGSAKNKLTNKKLQLNRVFLVASSLAFTDLAGERQTFIIPLPNELIRMLVDLP